MVEKIKDILVEVLKDKADIEKITGDTNLIELGLNSLNAIEMVVYLEDTFGIEINDEDLMLDNLSSIKMICNLIKHYEMQE